jgi:hypothetical protein
MALFQDTMDTDRIVKPLHQQGKRTICAIYMKGGDQLNYVGKAPIPTNLLADVKDRPNNRHIGFVPYKG